MSSGSTPRRLTDRARPTFPARAVVTAGMPYGNKDLHFGHVGGIFVPADALARFLRDRIGAENVMFVSGTDCFGSPIVHDHAARTNSGEFSGTLAEFAEENYRRQCESLERYSIRPDFFAASALPPAYEIHRDLGKTIVETLHAHGHLKKLTQPQAYDAEAKTFLSGRQVVGRCPIAGCRSEKAYADECSLGHQYNPTDLIEPRSTISGKTPEVRDVTNWYLPLQPFRDAMKRWLSELSEKKEWRPFALRALLEYFEPPTIHVKSDHMEVVDRLRDSLPTFEQKPGRSKSERLIFDRLEDLEVARERLAAEGVQYRTGKTLVPFRLTGNLDWGLPAPDLEGLDGLTFWVWPESLWAPISFCATHLEQTGRSREDWRDWWCSKDAAVYQVIGEDNLFFYGLAQGAIWLGMQGEDYSADVPEGQLQLTHLIANKHLLFGNTKASSSGAIKPPMAKELLDHYTPDQLRAHFLGLGMATNNARFSPLPFVPSKQPNAPDPVLKEGNLLSNALNRAVRSCFYTVQKYFDCRIPVGEVSEDIVEATEEAILAFEDAFFRHEFHTGMGVAAAFIRQINAHWTRHGPYKEECDAEVRRQALIDSFHLVRAAVVLLHPVAVEGTEMVREYLRVGPEFFSWEHVFEPVYAFMENPDEHRVEFLESKVDFFPKHPSQFK